jgi:hypothetical protein
VERAFAGSEADHDARTTACVLGGIVEGLETAEVDGRLDAERKSAHAVADDSDLQWRAQRSRFQCGEEPFVDESRWIEVAGKLAVVIERLVDVDAESIEATPELRIDSTELARDRELDAQCDELLQGALVNVTLEAPSLIVSGSDEPRPRLAKLSARGLKLGVEDGALVREQGSGADRTKKLGLVVERAVVDDRSGRHPFGNDVRQLLPSSGRRCGDFFSVDSDPARGGIAPEREAEAGVPESACKRCFHLVEGRTVHQELDRFSQDAAGDELRLHQREQESEGQQDACDDGHPAKGGVYRHRPARAREIDRHEGGVCDQERNSGDRAGEHCAPSRRPSNREASNDQRCRRNRDSDRDGAERLIPSQKEPSCVATRRRSEDTTRCR